MVLWPGPIGNPLMLSLYRGSGVEVGVDVPVGSGSAHRATKRRSRSIVTVIELENGEIPLGTSPAQVMNPTSHRAVTATRVPAGYRSSRDAGRTSMLPRFSGPTAVSSRYRRTGVGVGTRVGVGVGTAVAVGTGDGVGVGARAAVGAGIAVGTGTAVGVGAVVDVG